MTAEWKKPPLDRAQKKDELKRLREEVAVLREYHKVLTSGEQWLRSTVIELRKECARTVAAADRYAYLRAVGVLVEQDGEFKYLQGDELDALFHPTASASSGQIMDSNAYALVYGKP